MAHSNSAKKRIRQDVKRRAINRWRKANIKGALRDFEDSLHTGEKDQMEKALQNCYKQLDKVAAKGTIHKNRASRKKKRLALQMNRVLQA